MSAHSIRLRMAVLVALVATMLAFATTVAFAGPSDPTITPTELQSEITSAGGSLPGYMKTVVKGSKIVTLSVDVQAVTTGADTGLTDLSSLILFSSDDATITKIGGIAAGMSGSPIYVNIAGVDTLIGAVSYGDIFTTHGYGLATPIGAMADAQAAHPSPMPRRLTRPVMVDGQLKNKVLVVNDPSSVVAPAPDTIVAAPKRMVFLGGINPSSRLYKAYTKFLAARDIDLAQPLAGGLSSMVSTYDAPFEGGSSVAVLASRGDMWFGGIGTVTYIDTTTVDATAVVAFGHPAFWDGNSGLYLANAWIDGIWPSTYEAYKLGRPAAVRGTLTQDRSAAVIGVEGVMPHETPITAKATLLDKNGVVTTVAVSAVEIPKFVINSSNDNYYGIADMAAYVAGSRVFDAFKNPGSAVTTTTVTVQDTDATGTSQVYKLTRRNYYSDSYDIPSMVVADVSEMVGAFQAANGNGIAHADILSVDLESSFSPTRKEADIVDVSVAGGLKTGDNTVTVSFFQYGNPDTQTVDVALKIPAGVPLSGELDASSVNAGGTGPTSDFLSMMGQGTVSYGSGVSQSSIDRSTVKDVASELNSEVDNSVIDVSFQPVDMTRDLSSSSGNGNSPPTAPAPTKTYASVDATAGTDWVVTGSANKTSPLLDVYLDDPDTSVLSYGDSTLLQCDLIGVDTDGDVRVTGAGIPTMTVPTVAGSISYESPALRKTTLLTFTFLGNGDALPAHKAFHVFVQAGIGFSASKTSVNSGSPVNLTATLYPKNCGGKVAFQRWNGWDWSTMKTMTVPSSGKATFKFTPKSKGKVKFRARFLGNASNVANSSSPVTIKVK